MQYAFHEILDLDVFFFRTCKLETFVTYEWQECDDFLERMKRIRITPILQNSARCDFCNKLCKGAYTKHVRSLR